MFFGDSSTFNPTTDIPPLTGKVIIVTGGNAGLGKEAALEFARHRPREIWLACRSATKGEEVASEVEQQIDDAPPIKVLELDLSRFASVKKAASRVLAETDRLDILMLNAGAMALPPGLTEDGYEMQFGTNHMGHALLCKLLMPLLRRTAEEPGADVRVVSLSSRGHAHLFRGVPHWHLMKTTADELGCFGRYGESKLANALWARQLAKQYPQLTVSAVHPGLVQTQLMTKADGTSALVRTLVNVIGPWIVSSATHGARNQLWASVSKDVQSGEYYEPVGRAGLGSACARDDDLARKLWDWTEKELQGIQL
ncbi:Short-chain dehydrogenase [Geosmithia morbida]|uniref:Short-chain dehydrogenase n=1 Tax=Geosmithia morbida TaxID=1094350 RepID=A0A9P4YZ43_9HYPO|nr:Short-chain dehydrogenase [Geosmithia morbida]KAF4125738.1 Short-chain dehydrogenase [Geosmithia morbida]